jgi:hypothetical protein
VDITGLWRSFIPSAVCVLWGWRWGNVTFKVLKLGLEVVEIKVLRVKRWCLGMEILVSDVKFEGSGLFFSVCDIVTL